MKNIFFLLLTVFLFSSNSFAQAQEELDLEINVCIAQFPCHLKTGRLLPGFKSGTACKWERICEDYRDSSDFKKLQRKLKKQKKASKRSPVLIKPRG
jgi:hypothetical protein